MFDDEWVKIPPEKRKSWHWDDCIADAQKMLDLARKNPAILSVKMWEEQIEIRKAQKEKYLSQQVPVEAMPHPAAGTSS